MGDKIGVGHMKFSSKIINRIALWEKGRRTGENIKTKVKAQLTAVKVQPYLSMRGYPKTVTDVQKLPEYSGYADVGIVLQGPVCNEDNFTFETIRLMRHLYPDIQIVLSTYVGEVKDKRIIENLQCDLLENESMPSENKGQGEKIGYINNQIFSSIEGIKHLQRKGVKYILKMRSDFRLYKTDVIPYFLNLMKLFPMQDADGYSLNERLINVACSNTLYYFPFHMCDFVWFGRTEDVLNLYSTPFRTEEELKYIRNRTSDRKFMAHHHKAAQEAIRRILVYGEDDEDLDRWFRKLDFDIPFLTMYHEEICFAYSLYNRVRKKEKPVGMISQYHAFVRECMILVDEFDVLSYWPKYAETYYLPDYMAYDTTRYSHSKWMDDVGRI